MQKTRSTELLLIRHGESEANIGVSKDPDSNLTAKGLDQVRQVAARLGELDLRGFELISSPYTRAAHTASEISRAIGLPAVTEELVREWGDMATVGGRQYHKESAEELTARLGEFLRIVAGGKLIVVSHAAPIAVLTQLAWGETPNFEGEFWTGVGNCCLRWLRTTL